MLRELRQKKIIKYLDENHMAKTMELSRLLSATPETIRRDVRYLETEGLVEKVFGGVILKDSKENAPYDPSFMERINTDIKLKKRIAQRAARLIQPHDIIALDGSTTTLQIIPYIPDNVHITAVTNCYAVFASLIQKKNVEIILVGGYYRRKSTSFLGNVAQKALEEVNISKAFISGQAVSTGCGLMDPHEEEARFKNMLVNKANQVILLADSGRFNRLAPITVSPITSFDIIISDQGLSSEVQEYLESKNIVSYLV